MISGSYDRTLKMWDLNSGQFRMTFRFAAKLNIIEYRLISYKFHLRGHDEAVLCLKYDDKKIVSGSSDNSIKVVII